MTDARALLAAIYESPDDDAPRSVYADYLIERGDPRGEFIASQLAKRRARPGQRQRERELLAAHADDWCAPLGVAASHVKFERGFPAIVNTRPTSALAWSTVHTCSSPPRSNDCHVRALRTVTAASTDDIEALAFVTIPLAIESFRWGPPYDTTYDQRCEITTTSAAIGALTTRRFRRLDLGPTIVGSVMDPRWVDWAWPVATELVVSTRTEVLPDWIAAPIERLELVIPEAPAPRAWRLGMTITLDRDRNLTAVTRRAARYALASLTAALTPAIRSIRVAIPTQADMDATPTTRHELEARARHLDIPITIARATT